MQTTPNSRTHLIKYSIGIVVLSAVAFAGGHYVLHNVLNANIGMIFPISVVLLLVVSIIVQALLTRSNDAKPQAFIRSYMLSSSGKLFLYLAFMMVYALTHKDRAVPFILTFFTLYAIFTMYDVITSSKFFGKN